MHSGPEYGVCPPGSLKPGTDALLLAAWALRCLKAREKAWLRKCGRLRVAELGCGNGAALLFLARRMGCCDCLGLEKEASLVKAARENIDSSDQAEHIAVRQIDLEDPEAARSCTVGGGFHLAFANPPWRLPGERCASALRQEAIYDKGQTLACFCSAAANLLVYHGLFCLIAGSARLADICAALRSNRLGLRKILPVASFAERGASRLLFLAQKDAADDCAFLQTLALHRRTDRGVEWSREGLEFLEGEAG